METNITHINEDQIEICMRDTDNNNEEPNVEAYSNLLDSGQIVDTKTEKWKWTHCF